MTFARLCRETRMMLDVTQAELARSGGVSRSHIAGIETGRVNPSLDLVSRIADRLGIEVAFVARPPLIVSRRTHDVVHARCSGFVDGRFRRAGWLTAREIEIAEPSAHGWIDLLAYEPVSRTLVIVEVKTRLDDIGAVERQIGWYERRAVNAAQAIGWRPSRVLSWLIVLASDEVERAIRMNREVMLRSFPARAVTMRGVLADPRTDTPRRGLAMVDPRSRRGNWLIPTRSDGRRSASPFVDYADAAQQFGATPTPAVAPRQAR
jgi:transcriptional regulator with XRE-family HTH domain